MILIQAINEDRNGGVFFLLSVSSLDEGTISCRLSRHGILRYSTFSALTSFSESNMTVEAWSGGDGWWSAVTSRPGKETALRTAVPGLLQRYYDPW